MKRLILFLFIFVGFFASGQSLRCDVLSLTCSGGLLEVQYSTSTGSPTQSEFINPCEITTITDLSEQYAREPIRIYTSSGGVYTLYGETAGLTAEDMIAAITECGGDCLGAGEQPPPKDTVAICNFAELDSLMDLNKDSIIICPSPYLDSLFIVKDSVIICPSPYMDSILTLKDSVFICNLDTVPDYDNEVIYPICFVTDASDTVRTGALEVNWVDTTVVSSIYYDLTTGAPYFNVNVIDCKEPEYQTECVESQEWTYGIDNTGTRFNDIATYLITLSDGSTLTFSQDGSATSWTPQLIEWSNNIQAAADAAGLSWFVEPRFIDNFNPTNLDGTINGPGGTPSGLPGAASVPVAQGMFDGGMAWRYVNIQICPGQPVPVKAERIESAIYTNNPYNLTTAGAILGPLQKFFVCRSCGLEPIWYLEDGVTLAAAGQIPNCYEPCGTLTLAAAPPDRDCEFFIDLACDNNGQTDPLLFTNQITRRSTVCNGEQIALEYFEEDPTDPAALIEYTLVGDFVDCSTGEPIPMPDISGVIIDCDSTEITVESDNTVVIAGSENPIGVFMVDDCCGTPLGYQMCYGSNSGASYEIDDNETDGQFSIGGTGINTIKWEVESPAAASDGLADVTIAIRDCINSGEVANITVTDASNISYTFPADAILATGNADGSGGWAFTGPGAPASGSGKITLASVVCGTSSGRASAVRNCKTDSIEWFDDVTGEKLTPEQVENLYDCPLPETCETTTNEYVNCASEAGLTDEGTAISIGDQILSIVQVDCDNIAVASTLYHLPSQETISASLLTDQCDPDPQVEEVRECLIDANGIQWTQLSIIDPNDVNNPTVLFYDINNQIGTPAGSSDEWTSCDREIKTSVCIKWRNKYLGIDNTGTSFNTTYEIEVLQDGISVGTFIQTPSANNTLQLNQWIAGLQVLYPNALIEQRYAPNGGAGLPPPTAGLDFDQMAARYVQFTACDGDDLPTELRIISENNIPLATPRVMDTQVIFGEEVRGYVCYSCGDIPTLYYNDGTEIPASDIPPCYITCAENFEESGDRYTTTFDSEFFTSAFTVPSAPANTKEMVVFNNSGAWLEVTTNKGTELVPPRGTAEWSVYDYESGITITSVSLVGGTFGPNDTWGINYRITQ